MQTTCKHWETSYSRRPSATLTALWRTGIGSVCFLLAAAASPAQDEKLSPNVVKFKVLASFNGANGNVISGLNPVQGTDGSLYGTTRFGGAFGAGTIYRITPAGALTTIYSFCAETNCPDGAVPNPSGALALSTDGNFYGATTSGGPNAGYCPIAPFGCGTVFKITPSGALTTLHEFCLQPNCTDGDLSQGGVIRGDDGNFYGVTTGGGANINSMCDNGFDSGCGTVFTMTPQGVFNTIHSFCAQANCRDGGQPYGGLVSGADGNLYGITDVGGASGFGTIFKITPSGAFTILHSFDGIDGNCNLQACAPMVLGADGNLYGTTLAGGSGGSDCLPPGCGTFFKITPEGALTTLYSFCSKANCVDGVSPVGIVQATDGNFYGASNFGGTPGSYGTLFRITPEGVLTTLHTFDATDGSTPAGLVQATNGSLYGTASFGGANGDGTVFSLYVGLGPFVETVPSSAKVGRGVRILGTNLADATAVDFNGSAAKFIIVSRTEILTEVPAGATTGFITVTTPTETLTSNMKFRVRP